MLSACDENSWNDKLEGFEEPPTYSKTETINYTLTAADYASIASNSTNKSIAEAATDPDLNAEALAAIGANGTFATKEQARVFIPALLQSSSFPYFALNDGSSLKVTYNVASDLPDQVKDINRGVEQYTLTEDDYKMAWGSDDDYINGFAPMLPASKNLANVVADVWDGYDAGTYVVVTYNEASVNPIFGTVGGGDTPPAPAFEPTSVIATAKEGDNITIKGYVTAISTRGFIVTDNSGSLLCYQNSGFDPESVTIGSQVEVSGAVALYSGGLQIAITADSYTVTGTGEYTYPAPAFKTTQDIVDLCNSTASGYTATYVSFTGKLAISGNYMNVILDGTDEKQGSLAYVTNDLKAGLVDGNTYTFTGYFTYVTSKGKYFNLFLTSYKEAGKAAVTARRAPVNTIETTPLTALYYFDGSKWSVPANTYVLTPGDYTMMGQTYGNLSNDGPTTLLPIFLKTKYPFAAVDDAMTVVYKYYANSETKYRATQFIYNGTEWTVNAGAVTEQFTRTDGSFRYNPSVILTLPYARNTDPSYTYYMACVDWVFEAICKPMGDTSLTSGEYFIDYRGNAEFYSGASAYYGNVDIRATSAKSHCPEGYTGYDGLTDEQITLLMKKRFCTETMLHALEKLNADAMPNDGMEVTYTINFTAYDGAANEEQVVYIVTAPGKFKYKSSTWVSDGEDADW